MNGEEQNETSEGVLPPLQLDALLLLAEGFPKGEVAETVGIGRTTLWKWEQEPLFQAELSRLMNDRRAAFLDKARGLLSKALDVVGQSIQNGDTRAALEALRQSGLLSDPRLLESILGKQEEDPKELEAKRQQAEAQKNSREKLTQLMEGLSL